MMCCPLLFGRIDRLPVRCPRISPSPGLKEQFSSLSDRRAILGLYTYIEGTEPARSHFVYHYLFRVSTIIQEKDSKGLTV